MSDREALRVLGEVVGHTRVDQIAYLVPDLEQAVTDWNALIGAREWRTWRYSPETLPHLGYRGGAGKFDMRIALSTQGPQVELIQPMAGPSIYHDWIERRGYGPHHVGRFITRIDKAMRALRDVGLEPVQWATGYGLDGDGGFAYYELGPDAGTIVELIEPPIRRPPSVDL